METRQHVRFIPIEDCGLRVREVAEGQTESRRVEGRPIIFGVRSVNLTPWSESRVVYEVLEPGCISRELLQRSDVLLNINHSTKVTDIMGRCRNGKGTLDLELRDSYVEMGCDLPKTNCADDTLELIKRGDISGMSFAFFDDWQDSENGVSYERTNEMVDGKEVWIRHVKRIIDVRDVAIVTNPAYDQTSVATREVGEDIMKSIDRMLENDTEGDKVREVEEIAQKEAKNKEIEDIKRREMEAQRRRSRFHRMKTNSIINS